MDRACPASLEGVDQSLGGEKNREIHRKKNGAHMEIHDTWRFNGSLARFYMV